jgi:hypothetical protein
MFCSKGSMLIMHSYTNAYETQKWVTLQSNKMHTMLRNKDIILVEALTTFSSALTFSGVSMNTLALIVSLGWLLFAWVPWLLVAAMGQFLTWWPGLPHPKHSPNLHGPRCCLPWIRGEAVLSDTEAVLTHRSILSPKRSRITAERLFLWWWGRRRSPQWKWLLPINIVSSRFTDPFLNHGGSVHDLNIVSDFEENNPLTDSWRQTVAEPFGLSLFIEDEVWGIPQ